MIGRYFTRFLLAFAVGIFPCFGAFAASTYTPTMADMMDINAMLHRYLVGLDKHDANAIAGAFAEDGTLMLFEGEKLIINLKGRDNVIKFVSAPPNGAGATSVSAGASVSKSAVPGNGVNTSAPIKDMFHFIANDYYNFRTSTEAEHYAYWLDVSPTDGRTSVTGIPGHYEDIFVKRKGQWYILERKIYVGKK